VARKRMIDPNIWSSEDFGKLTTLAKVVFIGMFSNADDEGRGKAKAIYLKSVIFPYDEGIRVADVDKTLSEIGSNMSVTFYSHNGSEYYSFDNWSKWQTINRPTPSMIPEFDENDESFQRLFNERSMSTHGGLLPNRKEEEKKEKKKGKEENIKGDGGGLDEPPAKPAITADDVFNKYNAICINNPKAKIFSSSRREKVNTRLKEEAFRENYVEVFKIVATNPFLQGKTDSHWKADFDWLIENDKNYVKVLEGKYENTKTEEKVNTSNVFDRLLRKEMEADGQAGNYDGS